MRQAAGEGERLDRSVEKIREGRVQKGWGVKGCVCGKGGRYLRGGGGGLRE